MFVRKIVIALSMLIFMGGAVAQSIAVNPEHPDRHTVVKGDTLWDISAKFLRDPWRWPQVWEHNPEIKNPHLIYPGDVIYLSYRNGQPVLSVDRSARTNNAVVKLSPKMRENSLDTAPISAIPYERIAPFLSNSRVVSDRDLEYSGYIVGNEEGRLIAGEGHLIYVRNLVLTDNHRYMIFRPGKAYFSPDDPERALGYQATFIGTAELLELSEPSTLRVTSSSREVLNGDQLLPILPEATLKEYIPQAPDELLDGYILGQLDGVSHIGQYQVIVLSLGDIDGVQKGHVLNIWQEGALITDRYSKKKEKVRLPDSIAGTAMIIRIFESTSYALVMNAYKEIKAYDKVMTP